MCHNTMIIISVIEGNKQIQKIYTKGKNAVEEARKQLEEKYLQEEKKELR